MLKKILNYLANLINQNDQILTELSKINED